MANATLAVLPRVERVIWWSRFVAIGAKTSVELMMLIASVSAEVTHANIARTFLIDVTFIAMYVAIMTGTGIAPGVSP